MGLGCHQEAKIIRHKGTHGQVTLSCLIESRASCAIGILSYADVRVTGRPFFP